MNAGQWRLHPEENNHLNRRGLGKSENTSNRSTTSSRSKARLSTTRFTPASQEKVLGIGTSRLRSDSRTLRRSTIWEGRQTRSRFSISGRRKKLRPRQSAAASLGKQYRLGSCEKPLCFRPHRGRRLRASQHSSRELMADQKRWTVLERVSGAGSIGCQGWRICTRISLRLSAMTINVMLRGRWLTEAGLLELLEKQTMSYRKQ